MKQTIFLFVAAFLLVLPQALPGGAHAHGAGGEASAMFKAYEHGKIPAAYKGKANPLSPDPANIDAAIRIYEANCVMCHGANADGKGHMAEMMKAKPADLKAMFAMMPKIDDYYFWVIKEGGGAFDIPMPGYDGALSDTQIWQVITWMQDGFAGTDGAIQDRMHDGEHHGKDHGKEHGKDHMMQRGRGMPDHMMRK